MKFLHRRVLLGLVAGICALAFPAVAAATINPSLVLTPSGPEGATNQTLTYNLSFSGQTPSTDSPTSITTIFPHGMLADSTLVNSANHMLCLQTPSSDANAINSGCQVGNGSATLTGVGPVPAAEYLVAPPDPSKDVAGVLLVLDTPSPTKITTAAVTISQDQITVPFTGLPSSPQLTNLTLQLTHLRLPSNCAANPMTVKTVSANGNKESTTAQYHSTGCPGQAYSPAISGLVKNSSSGAEVVTTTTQKSGEAASKKIVLTLPSSLTVNANAATACFGNPSCQIGTSSAASPLAPVPLPGTLTLGGVGTTHTTMTIKFKPPYNLTIVGDISGNSVTFNNVPDSPLTSLITDITGTQFGSLYTTNCQPGNVTAQFTGQGGQSHAASAPIKYTGCSTTPPPTIGSPKASGSLGGLASRHPSLRLHLSHGTNAPKLRSVSIRVGSGLSFKRSAIVNHKHAKGLTVSGGKVKSIKLKNGKLVITLVRPVSALSIKVRGPLLSESKALQKKIKEHKVKRLTVKVKMTDASGKATTRTLHLKA